MPDDALEVDPRFPSGEWTGFFLQSPATSRSWMQLRISFQQGALKGDGKDWVGQFTMDGGYELKEGRCWWTKRYVGRHDVSYSGYNEGKGIWGVWEIPPRGKGGFHIWPAGMPDPTRQHFEESEQVPADAISPRTMTRRTFIGG